MPYSDALHSLSDWYVQLLSESLGKMSNTCLPYGRTPVAAVGTMDMHAQVQEHQEGRLNKVVQFIKVKDWKHNLIVPDTYSEYERLHSLSDVGICDILNIALDANREALSSDNRFNMTITVPTLNAFHLGKLCLCIVGRFISSLFLLVLMPLTNQVLRSINVSSGLN